MISLGWIPIQIQNTSMFKDQSPTRVIRGRIRKETNISKSNFRNVAFILFNSCTTHFRMTVFNFVISIASWLNPFSKRTNCNEFCKAAAYLQVKRNIFLYKKVVPPWNLQNCLQSERLDSDTLLYMSSLLKKITFYSSSSTVLKILWFAPMCSRYAASWDQGHHKGLLLGG